MLTGWVIVRLFPDERAGAMPSAVESSDPVSADDLPDGRIGCLGPFAVLGILAFWVIIGAVGYMGMFTCIHTGYGSSPTGCHYEGTAAGTTFVAVTTVVGSISLYVMYVFAKRRAPGGWQPFVWSAAAALTIALIVLFVGSPWPEPPVTTTAAPATTAPPGTTAVTPDAAPTTTEALPASTTSITVVMRYELLILHGNGLGAALFGMPLEAALRRGEHYLGPPDIDDDDGDMYHSVEWGDLGFALYFSSADFYRDDGVEHLVGWGLERSSPSAPRTMGGVGIGDTFEMLVAAHGSGVAVPDSFDECLPQWYVWLDDPSGDPQQRVLVVFDGPVEDRDSRIGSMRAGAGYGC